MLFYTNKITKKNRYIIFLVLLPHILCTWPLLTDKYLYLIIDEMIENYMVTRWGILFYVNVIVSYIYFLTGCVIIAYKTFKEGKNLIQGVLFILAVLVPVLLNFLTGTGIIKTLGFDIVPVSFSFVLAAVSMLVFKYRIIDIVPIAYNKLFNNINSAAVIVDNKGNIFVYNSIFAEYFSNILDPGLCKNILSFLNIIGEYTDEKPNLEKIREDRGSAKAIHCR